MQIQIGLHCVQPAVFRKSIPIVVRSVDAAIQRLSGIILLEDITIHFSKYRSVIDLSLIHI